MEAKLFNLSQFLKNPDTQFIIPVYQRNYDWLETQCNKLLKDILVVSKSQTLLSHFIGSIVFIQDSIYMTSSRIQLTIIDGQQRLTTVTLLILAIAHSIIEKGNEKLAKQLIKKYIINEDFENDQLKLKPTLKDAEALAYLVANDFSEPFKNYSRIIENYFYFKNEVAKLDIDTILKGVDKINFVEVSLERGKDEPQRIFESLNSTGLDLSQADLIRNYVLMDLEPKKQQQIYENIWVKIENYTIDEITHQTKLSDFIRDYLTLKFRDIPNKNKVFITFRNKYEFPNNEDKVEKIESQLQEIKLFASFYNKLINPSHEKEKDIQEHLRYIHKLEINVVNPFILEIYQDYATKIIDKQTFIKVLILIQSYVWRRFIMGLPTNVLNKVFMSLYTNVNKENYVSSIEKALVSKKGQHRFPIDAEVIAEIKIKDFYNTQSKNRIYFLERLENFGKAIPFYIEGNSKVTTEHILPQKPSTDWKIGLGNTLELFHQKYLNNIGNLTISGNNGELGNKSFAFKRDQPDYGYRSSGLWLNQYLSNIENWTEVELLVRLEIITKKTLQIWAYPSINYDDVTETSEEMNIFDIDTVTHKKIEYFIFFDKKYKNPSFIELLQNVAKNLFEIDPKKFFDTDLKNKLSLTQNKQELRASIKISSSYYIESNMSADAVIKRVKLLLITFDLSDELYIKFDDKPTSN